MGTCALYSSAHLNRDSLGSEPRSCVLLSGVRYKRPLANTCGAPKWARSGGSGLGRARSCLLSPLEETGLEQLDDIEDGHVGLDQQHHLGII